MAQTDTPGKFHDPLSMWKEVLAIVSTSVSVIGAAVAIFFSIQSQISQKNASDSQAAAQSSAHSAADSAALAHAAIEQKEEDRQRIMAVYNEVIGALTADEKRQLAASALVQFYIKGDNADEQQLKAGMLNLLHREAVSPAVKAETANAIFAVQESSVAPPPPAPASTQPSAELRSVKIDVFWCEGADARAERSAQNVTAILTPLSNGRVRTRILPAAINARSGYSASGVEIRPDASEVGLAQTVEGKIAKQLIADGVIQEQTNIAIKPVGGRPTPDYLSVFICPRA